jgi:hypothetical protein
MNPLLLVLVLVVVLGFAGFFEDENENEEEDEPASGCKLAPMGGNPSCDPIRRIIVHKTASKYAQAALWEPADGERFGSRDR